MSKYAVAFMTERKLSGGDTRMVMHLNVFEAISIEEAIGLMVRTLKSDDGAMGPYRAMEIIETTPTAAGDERGGK